MPAERFDLIFLRNDLRLSDISRVGPVRIDGVGDEPADRTLSGLWPSDHAGVAAQIHIPLRNGQGRLVADGRAR